MTKDLGGRPSDYTEELADLICGRVACGESMRSISRDESMPAMSTFFKWLREKDGFSEQYAQAKHESAESWADDIVDIADNQATEPLVIEGKTVLDGDGNQVMVASQVSIAHAKLRVDARKWSASKLKPKKYGDKITQEHTGKDGGAIQTQAISFIPVGNEPTRTD